MNRKSVQILFAFLSFAIPFFLYALTKSSSLMFDDAAEFALVIKLGSIAHPPGTPAYILSGILWMKFSSLFSSDAIALLTLFSSFSLAAASLLLFLMLSKISGAVVSLADSKLIQSGFYTSTFAPFITTMAFATGNTTWAWGNNIEVYAFQVLSTAILMFGLVFYQYEKKYLYLVLAAFGYALGLSNHHLEAVLLAPFIPLFFFRDSIFKGKTSGSKDPKVKQQESWLTQYVKTLTGKPFLIFASLSAVVTAAFYFWMYLRAQTNYPFMFGQPDTLAGMIYHIKGGNYAKNLEATTAAIRQARFQYFLQLTFFQFLLFSPFLLIGIFSAVRNKMFRLLVTCLLFFSLLFAYQVNNNQWASTDAYMLVPFFMLSFLLYYGLKEYLLKWRLHIFLPLVLIVTASYNYKKNNKTDYNVSESLLQMLDESAPPNSILLISDWSLVIQYYYARIAENFRTDLIVLNYDIKFTHFKILPTLYPGFYKQIQPEYDKYIDELRKVHPEQVVGTGCDLSTIELMNSFKNLVAKMESIAREQNISFLTDPKANYFFLKEDIYSAQRFVSGCFVSSNYTDPKYSTRFIEMNEKWLDSPLLLNDPTALDKLVDFQAMLDNHITIYTAKKNTAQLEKAMNAKQKVMKLQRRIKQEMPFAYKLK